MVAPTAVTPTGEIVFDGSNTDVPNVKTVMFKRPMPCAIRKQVVKNEMLRSYGVNLQSEAQPTLDNEARLLSDFHALDVIDGEIPAFPQFDDIAQRLVGNYDMKRARIIKTKAKVARMSKIIEGLERLIEVRSKHITKAVQQPLRRQLAKAQQAAEAWRRKFISHNINVRKRYVELRDADHVSLGEETLEE